MAKVFYICLIGCLGATCLKCFVTFKNICNGER
jgi:hypothetical protein